MVSVSRFVGKRSPTSVDLSHSNAHIPAGTISRSEASTAILIHWSCLSRTSKNPEPSRMNRISSSSWMCSSKKNLIFSS
jgi:hypothetical protein